MGPTPEHDYRERVYIKLTALSVARYVCAQSHIMPLRYPLILQKL